MVRIKLQEVEASRQKDREHNAKLQAEIEAEKLRLKAELDLQAEKLRLQEERKTKKVLAKLQQVELLPLTPVNIINTIVDEPGISQRELGRRFGKSPQTVLSRVNDLIEAGSITANGDGVHYIK